MPIPHHILKETSIDAAVDLLLHDASAAGVSEVFLEPSARDAVVRVRRDGLLHEWFHQSKESHGKFLERLKQLARLHEEAPLARQERPLRRAASGEEVEGWIEIVPVLEGEKAVLHLQGERLGLDTLGMDRIQQEGLKRHLRSTSGLLVLAGPRRSGLTTTLHALLEAANPSRAHVALLEKEFRADVLGVDQEPAEPANGRSLSSLLRAAAARGAEIIGLGTLNDEATAALAVSIAEHRLVIAVLEAESMPDALHGLLELRIEAKHAARVLSGVLVQRLARRVCSDCRRRATMTRAEAAVVWPSALVRRVFGKNEVITIERGMKCETCRFTGHQGQVGLFEWNDLAVPARQRLTLLDDGLRKVLSGAIAPEELLRV